MYCLLLLKLTIKTKALETIKKENERLKGENLDLKDAVSSFYELQLTQ